MNFKEYTLYRLDYDPQGTPGEFRNSVSKLFSTLERPNNGNKKDDPNTNLNEAGCIPEGRYFCRPYSSKKFPGTFEIFGVRTKTSVLFHSGNCIDDSKSCVLMGKKIVNNVKHPSKHIVYKYWLSDSRAAFADFKRIMPKEGFFINITSKRTEEACRL